MSYLALRLVEHCESEDPGHYAGDGLVYPGHEGFSLDASRAFDATGAGAGTGRAACHVHLGTALLTLRLGGVSLPQAQYY